jgi:carbonyl reductase 1
MDQRRIAVVTGASRGIGLAIARALVERGLEVVGTCRDDEGRASVASIGAEPFVADVTSDESVARLARRLEAGLDVLVDNAGIALDGFDAEVARRTLDVNFFGALRVTEGLLPLLRTDGRVVMVSSMMGELSCLSPEKRALFASPTLTKAELVALARSFVDDVAAGVHAERGWPSSAYRVSKVAMNALVRVYARELADDPRGVLVNAACPGWVRTRMGGSGAPRSPERGAKTPVWLALLPKGGPTGGFFQDETAVDF